MSNGVTQKGSSPAGIGGDLPELGVGTLVEYLADYSRMRERRQPLLDPSLEQVVVARDPVLMTVLGRGRSSVAGPLGRGYGTIDR